MRKALITGGGGFVGKKIVEFLLEKNIECAVIGRNRYPELEKLGVSCFCADIADPSIVEHDFRGFDTVFHVAALAGVWGTWADYYKTNVLGTKNIIALCFKNSINHLIYTSTPSVVFNGTDIINGDETLPYATRFLCHYARSKVIAEKCVLDACQEGLYACAIRPHLVWGPEDPHLIPRLIERGKRKQLKIIGNGQNIVDISYVDNVAQAHILAAQNLWTTKSANGKAYFISDDNPVALWKWINALFLTQNIPQISSKVPFNLAYAAGGLLEFVYKIFHLRNEPKMTRFVAEQLAKSHYFSHENAKNDLGYTPIVSADEGMEKLLKWIKINEKK